MTKKSILERRIFLKKQLITLLKVEIESLEDLLVMHKRLELADFEDGTKCTTRYAKV